MTNFDDSKRKNNKKTFITVWFDKSMDENVSSAVLPGHSLDYFYGGMGGRKDVICKVGNKKKDCVSMCASGFSW